MDTQISLAEQFDELIERMKMDKPNDRSEKDRYWAIATTQLEIAKAIFITYADSVNQYGV